MFTEPRAKAEVLNSQFSGVFNNEKIEDIPGSGENPIPTIETLTITASGIEKQLNYGLKADKTYGPDGIHPGFYRKMPRKYQRFLLIFIKTVSIPELCPANGNTPTYVPFTRNERNRVHQTIGPYHTSIASKVLKHSHVMKHLSQYGVLTDYQHGFWVKRSTETQLICTIHDIGSAI